MDHKKTTSFVVLLLIPFFLSSCGLFSTVPLGGGAGGPPPPQRHYAKLEFDDLYKIIEAVLIKEVYSIHSHEKYRGYFSTDWKEYTGDRHGLFKWKERRSFWFHIQIDPTRKFSNNFRLDLYVQERAPISTGWRYKNVEQEHDDEFKRILYSIDEAVQDNGGELAWTQKNYAHG